MIEKYGHTLDHAIQTKTDEAWKTHRLIYTEDVECNHPIGQFSGDFKKASQLDQFSQFFHGNSSRDIYKLDLEKGTASVRANALVVHVYNPHQGVDDPVDKLRDFTLLGGPYDFEFRRNEGEWKICKNYMGRKFLPRHRSSFVTF